MTTLTKAVIITTAIAATTGCANLSPYGRNTTHPMDPTASYNRVPTGSPYGNIATGQPTNGFFDHQGDYWAPTGRSYVRTVIVQPQVAQPAVQVPVEALYSVEDRISIELDKLITYCVDRMPVGQDMHIQTWQKDCVKWAENTLMARIHPELPSAD